MTVTNAVPFLTISFSIGVYALYKFWYYCILTEVKYNLEVANVTISNLLFREHMSIPISDKKKKDTLEMLSRNKRFANKFLNKKDAEYYTEIYDVIISRMEHIWLTLL